MSVSSIGSGAFYTAVSGMQRESDRVNQDANQIVGGDLEPQPVVDLNLAATNLTADAEVAQTADNMAKTLLDILA
jgi:hypothetical protein